MEVTGICNPVTYSGTLGPANYQTVVLYRNSKCILKSSIACFAITCKTVTLSLRQKRSALADDVRR